MNKIALTCEQIDEIANEIPINKAIPREVAVAIRNKIIMRLINDLQNVRLYSHLFQEFKTRIIREYHHTLIAAGEAVGIQTAMSLGERQTQSTLNTFHSAGMTIKSVLTGVPRFSELLNATKSPKIVNCLIFLNSTYNNIEDLRNAAGSDFTEITLKRLAIKSELIKNEPLEKWHHFFCDIHKTDISQHGGWRVRFTINIELLYEYKISLKKIAQKIEAEYGDAVVLYTPDWKGIIDVFVQDSVFENIEKEEKEEDEEIIKEVDDDDLAEDDPTEDDELLLDASSALENLGVITSSRPKGIVEDLLEEEEEKEDVLPNDIDKIIHIEDKIIPALENIKICGMSGIKEIFFEKRNNEWIITTEGSNLYELFSHPMVDKTKTLCNNMWEIYNVFGIEATRQFLIEEYMDVVSSDGTYVNLSHIEILVDIMVYTGIIISINRYGQKKTQSGPLSMSSFEESLDVFLKAGVNGSKETTDGVSASIMLGKLPKIGTGIMDLLVDVDKLMNCNLDQKVIKNHIPVLSAQGVQNVIESTTTTITLSSPKPSAFKNPTPVLKVQGVQNVIKSTTPTTITLSSSRPSVFKNKQKNKKIIPILTESKSIPHTESTFFKL